MNNREEIDKVLNWISKISMVTNTNKTLFKDNNEDMNKCDLINDILKEQKVNIKIINENKDKVDWSKSKVNKPIYWDSFDMLISKLTKILFNIKNGIKVNKKTLKYTVKKLLRNVISLGHEIERINHA